ncbi:hypothetical protein BS333_18970 [Vibrio azureus]|uniref:DUF2066 domain-containing protein n=1 Tax=Vibrio azureus NBRC 104587 TaxID=1219077 RepID=U3AUN8_9VIBR|nr:DUF3103 family protein [Vibrio azureus]AUI88410.1 hypothetical protein BS333_18970 [Vibrio azureus]GAD77470.1 hypothetical protein VAZ01S_077_00070 [Vibrio azureus NBRC 104587]
MFRIVTLIVSLLMTTLVFSQTTKELALDLGKDIVSSWNENKSIVDDSFSHGEFSVNMLMLNFPDDTKETLSQLEESIRQARELDDSMQDFLVLRLANPALLPYWQAEVPPLFVYQTNLKEGEVIPALTLAGEQVLLDPVVMPNQPVLVLDVDRSRLMREVANKMNLTIHQLTAASSMFNEPDQENSEPQNQEQDTPLPEQEEEEFPNEIHTTVIKKFKANYIKELWLQPSEVYAIVTGVSPSRLVPQIDIVEMPVVDFANIEYPVNQIAIYWQRYRWAAADIIFMEMDDQINFKNIAQNLVQIAQEVLNNIEDPRVKKYAVIPQITNRIIEEFPESVFIDHDDVIDALYTIQKNETYTDYSAAGGNVTVTLEPLVIGEVD